MSEPNFEPLPPDVERLFVVERSIPPVPADVERTIWARVAGTLGLGGGGGGGGHGGTAAKGAAAGIIIKLLVFVAAGSAVVGGWTLIERAMEKRAGRAAKSGHGTSDPAAIRGSGSVAPDAPLPGWHDQPGVALQEIGGVVLVDDMPAPGVEVVVSSEASVAAGGPEAVLRTEADGRFRYMPRQRANYWITASAPDRTGVTVPVDVRVPDPKPAIDSLVLRLESCGPEVHGVVADAQGTPVPAARVRLLAGNTWMGQFGPTVFTDSEGTYRICVPLGRALLRVDVDGFGMAAGELTASGRHTLNFTVVPEGTIVGRVVDADDGRPVANAQINLTGPSGVRPCMSGSDGRFEAGGLAPGQYMLNGWAPEHLSVIQQGNVIVEAGSISDAGDLRLTAAARVSGVVLENGRPVVGAKVRAVMNDGRVVPSFIGITQRDGTFSLSAAIVGKNELSIEGYEVISPLAVSVTSEGVRDVRVEVRAMGSIAGRVARNGRPIADARVDVVGRRRQSVTSDAEGRFIVRGLAAGDYKLAAQSERAGAFSTQIVDVQLGDRQALDGVVVDLDGGASIAGVVVDETGAPQAGLEVTFNHVSADDLGRGITDDDGRFTTMMLAGGGDYAATVREYAGIDPVLPIIGAGPVTVGASDTHVAGVRLVVRRQMGTIRGTVVDETGTSVPDAVLSALPQGAGSDRGPRAMTDASGSFAIEVLAGTTYQLTAAGGSGASAAPVPAKAGQDGIVVRVTRPGRLEGTLRGMPDAFVRVRLVGARNPPFLWARVEKEHFVFASLPPGSYVIAAGSPSSVDARQVDVRPGETTSITLEGSGAALLTGMVRVFPSGEPVGGTECRATIAVGDELPPLTPSNDRKGTSGADGRFRIRAAPIGEVLVTCEGDPVKFSDGIGRTRVAAGGGEVEVWLVPQGTQRPNTIGVTLDWLRMVPTVGAVLAGSPAALAGVLTGDKVVTVDGADVTRLSAKGVTILIGNRPIGATVKLRMVRHGKSIDVQAVVGPPTE